MRPNNGCDCGQHPQILQVLEAADDAGQAIGDVGELGGDVGYLLVQEQGDQGSVQHGVEALLQESLGRVLKRTDKISNSSA